MKFDKWQYRVVANVTFTVEELRHLIQVALSHYDGKCQKWGGDQLNNYELTGVTEMSLRWSDLDLMCKILEQERYHDGPRMQDQIAELFKKLREESERVNGK